MMLLLQDDSLRFGIDGAESDLMLDLNEDERQLLGESLRQKMMVGILRDCLDWEAILFVCVDRFDGFVKL